MNIPEKGFIFYPVGNGDSITIVINKEKGLMMQIDMNHQKQAQEEETPYFDIIKELISILPKKNKKPFLSVFVLTHPDKDHINGFKDLLENVIIGEIWHTPRILSEYKKDLCEDAIAFKEEVERRIKKTIKSEANIEAGDHIRIIGNDDLFEQDNYKNFPKKWRSYPGNPITEIDNNDIGESFEAFIHAPFKDESSGDRNNTSLSLHITLKEKKINIKALFFGDREYPTVKKIFEKTEEKNHTEYLKWDITLVPHHCSKAVMYWKDENDSEEVFKEDIIDYFDKYENENAYLIASCESDFSDKENKNPPHKKARKRYEEIIDSGHFLCTHEYPDKKNPQPIIFELQSNTFSLKDERNNSNTNDDSSLEDAIQRARGDKEPPSEKTGFGINEY